MVTSSGEKNDEKKIAMGIFPLKLNATRSFPFKLRVQHNFNCEFSRIYYGPRDQTTFPT